MVDITMSISEWEGMDDTRTSVLQLSSSTGRRLLDVLADEAIEFDSLLDLMLDEFLSARSLGQVHPNHGRDVPRPGSYAACGG